MKKQRDLKHDSSLELAVSALVVNYNTDYPALLLYPKTTWESTAHKTESRGPPTLVQKNDSFQTVDIKQKISAGCDLSEKGNEGSYEKPGKSSQVTVQEGELNLGSLMQNEPTVCITRQGGSAAALYKTPSNTEGRGGAPAFDLSVQKLSHLESAWKEALWLPSYQTHCSKTPLITATASSLRCWVTGEFAL